MAKLMTSYGLHVELAVVIVHGVFLATILRILENWTHKNRTLVGISPRYLNIRQQGDRRLYVLTPYLVSHEQMTPFSVFL